MKNKKGKRREYLDAALRAGEDKLLHNPSRGEGVLCWVTVIFALMSLVMSAVSAIAGGDAMTIARAFTEKPIWFALIALLTVYDRVFVFRGRSLTVIVFCLLSVARDVFGVVGASGFNVVLASVSLIAGAAFYGTLFVDQLNPNDSKLKYRVVYGGALLKVILILVAVIAGGTKLAQAGTAEVLNVMSRGLTEIFVVALMICHFDGFGYFRYAVSEITSSEAVEEPDAPETAEPSDDSPRAVRREPAQVSFDDSEPEEAYVPFDDGGESAEAEEASEDEAESASADADADETGAAYVPFEDDPRAATPVTLPDTSEERPVVTGEVSEENAQPETTDGETAQAPAGEAHSGDDVIDDFVYVPYDDNADTAVDSSVRPVTPADDAEKAATDGAYDYDEQVTVVEEGDVLVDESVIEYEREQKRAREAAAAKAAKEAEEARKAEAARKAMEAQKAKEAEAARAAAQSLASDEPDESYESAEYVAYADDATDEAVVGDEAALDETAHDVQDDYAGAGSVEELWERLTPIERRYVSFGLAHHKPEDTLQVKGLSGDLFDVWVDDEVICFQNDLEQASGGRGVRTAAIPFESVQGIGLSRLGGEECIVLTYVQDGEAVKIGFTKDSFGNFKRVMMQAAEN